MAAISSRLGLINYCLRKLGEPVIEVNVDEDQVEDKSMMRYRFIKSFIRTPHTEHTTPLL